MTTYKEPYASLFDFAERWKKQVKFGYANAVKSAHGENLEFIFGPREERTPIKLLDTSDYERKYEAIRKYNNPKYNVNKGVMNLEAFGNVDFVTGFKLALDALKYCKDPETNQGVLWGLELSKYDLDEAVMMGLAVPQEMVRMNMKAQRVIYLHRMFQIAMNFDSSLVFGAKGRYSEEDEKVYINDGMQGSFALALHGVHTLIVGFSQKDLPYIDYNQFIACNSDVMPITDYDLAKVRNNRAKTMLEAGLESKLEDKPAYDLFKIMENVNITLVPESAKPGAGESKHTSHFQKHFKEFCKNSYKLRGPFEAALKTVRNAWPFASVDHAPVWGLTEMYKLMSPKDLTDDFIIRLGKILEEKWTDSGKVWSDVLKAIRAQYPEKDKSGRYTEWKDHRYTAGGNRGLMIAAAIKDLVESQEAYTRSQPGKQKGYDLTIPTITKGGQEFQLSMPYSYVDSNGNLKDYVPEAVEIEVNERVAEFM